MATATIALFVSIGSVCVTLGGLVWQFALYKLSGARLKVQLVFIYLDEAHVLSRNVTKKRQPWVDDDDVIKLGEYGVEAAEVRVTNVGRSPISVDDISLDLGRPKRLSRYRRSVAFLRLHDEDSRTAELRDPTDGPARLEPGDSASRVFHLWPYLNHHIDKMGGRINLRGTAHAVGRRSNTRSPRRFGWRFTSSDDTWFTNLEVTPELRVYRRAWVLSYRKHTHGVPLLMHREISTKLREGATVDGIAEYLLSLDDSGIYRTAAFDLHEAFHADRTATPSN